MLAELSAGETLLRTRTGRDATEQYPSCMVHELVDQVNAVIDGEIVASMTRAARRSRCCSNG